MKIILKLIQLKINLLLLLKKLNRLFYKYLIILLYFFLIFFIYKLNYHFAAVNDE